MIYSPVITKENQREWDEGSDQGKKIMSAHFGYCFSRCLSLLNVNIQKRKSVNNGLLAT